MSRAVCESTQSQGDPEGTWFSAFGPCPPWLRVRNAIVSLLPAKARRFLEKGLAFTGGTRIALTQASLDYTRALVWGSPVTAALLGEARPPGSLLPGSWLAGPRALRRPKTATPVPYRVVRLWPLCPSPRAEGQPVGPHTSSAPSRQQSHLRWLCRPLSAEAGVGRPWLAMSSHSLSQLAKPWGSSCHLPRLGAARRHRVLQAHTLLPHCGPGALAPTRWPF